jgi:hypothetical protein
MKNAIPLTSIALALLIVYGRPASADVIDLEGHLTTLTGQSVWCSSAIAYPEAQVKKIQVKVSCDSMVGGNSARAVAIAALERHGFDVIIDSEILTSFHPNHQHMTDEWMLTYTRGNAPE